jgi:hypothetical protein
MLKPTLIILILSLLLAAAGCAGGEKETADAAASPAAAPPVAEVAYGSGTYDLERGPDGSTWRWLGPEGVVRLKNTGRDMKLKIVGRAPLDRFPKPPVVTITLNGERLDQVTTTAAPLDREYTIPAAKQSGEWSELRITSDRHFVPKDVHKGSNDTRQLSFSLSSVSWEPL